MFARCWLSVWLVVFGLTLAQAAEPNQLTSKELADGWLLLFDGETTYGWKAESKANWTVKDGTIQVSEGEPGLLRTTSQFADYELLVDFKAAKGTNSGVFLRTAPVIAKEGVTDPVLRTQHRAPGQSVSDRRVCGTAKRGKR